MPDITRDSTDDNERALAYRTLTGRSPRSGAPAYGAHGHGGLDPLPVPYGDRAPSRMRALVEATAEHRRERLGEEPDAAELAAGAASTRVDYSGGEGA